MIDHTAENGSIVLDLGVYTKRIIILRPITLDGANSTIITDKGPTMSVFADNTTLKGLKLGLNGEADNGDTPFVLMLRQDHRIKLENVEINGRVCDHLGRPATLREVAGNWFVIDPPDLGRAATLSREGQFAGTESESKEPGSIGSDVKERARSPVVRWAVAASFAVVLGLGLVGFAFRGGSDDSMGRTKRHGAAEVQASVGRMAAAGNPAGENGHEGAGKELVKAESRVEKPFREGSDAPENIRQQMKPTGKRVEASPAESKPGMELARLNEAHGTDANGGNGQVSVPEPASLKHVRLADGTTFEAGITEEGSRYPHFSVHVSVVERAVFAPEHDVLLLKAGGEIKGKIIAHENDHYGIVVSASEVTNMD